MRTPSPEERRARIREHQKLLVEIRKNPILRALDYGMIYWADNRLHLYPLMVGCASLDVIVYKFFTAFAYQVDLTNDPVLNIAKWMFGASVAAVSYLSVEFMRGFHLHVVSGVPPVSAVPNISVAPGTRIRACAEFLCSPKVFANIVEPLISDLQLEYFEALGRQQTWKARWIRLRYACILLEAIGLLAFIMFLKKLWGSLE